MKRSSFQRPAPRVRQMEGYTPRPRPTAVAQVQPAEKPAAAPAPKLSRKARTQQSLRDSARDEACTVRLPGCANDPAATIWSHAPLGAAGKGMGIKALDLCGAYCCTACDALVDGQRPLPSGMTREAALLAWFDGHMRSLVRAKTKGVI